MAAQAVLGSLEVNRSLRAARAAGPTENYWAHTKDAGGSFAPRPSGQRGAKYPFRFIYESV